MIVEFIKWLGQFAEDGKTNKPSSKRVIALMAGTALSIGALALLLAKAMWVWCNGGEIATELFAVTAPLCTLAGFNYAAGRVIETKQKTPEPEPQQ